MASRIVARYYPDRGRQYSAALPYIKAPAAAVADGIRALLFSSISTIVLVILSSANINEGCCAPPLRQLVKRYCGIVFLKIVLLSRYLSHPWRRQRPITGTVDVPNNGTSIIANNVIDGINYRLAVISDVIVTLCT